MIRQLSDKEEQGVEAAEDDEAHKVVVHNRPYFTLWLHAHLNSTGKPGVNSAGKPGINSTGKPGVNPGCLEIYVA